jgi:hypothetical protein
MKSLSWHARKSSAPTRSSGVSSRFSERLSTLSARSAPYRGSAAPSRAFPCRLGAARSGRRAGGAQCRNLTAGRYFARLARLYSLARSAAAGPASRSGRWDRRVDALPDPPLMMEVADAEGHLRINHRIGRGQLSQALRRHDTSRRRPRRHAGRAAVDRARPLGRRVADGRAGATPVILGLRR